MLEIEGINAYYGDLQALWGVSLHVNDGELVALVDSENFIEIAVVNGSAARVTGAQVGDVLEIVTTSHNSL